MTRGERRTAATFLRQRTRAPNPKRIGLLLITATLRLPAKMRHLGLFFFSTPLHPLPSAGGPSDTGERGFCLLSICSTTATPHQAHLPHSIFVQGAAPRVLLLMLLMPMPRLFGSGLLVVQMHVAPEDAGARVDGEVGHPPTITSGVFLAPCAPSRHLLLLGCYFRRAGCVWFQ